MQTTYILLNCYLFNTFKFKVLNFRKLLNFCNILTQNDCSRVVFYNKKKVLLCIKFKYLIWKYQKTIS